MYLHGLAAVLIAASLTIVLHSRMPDWARKTSSDVHNPLRDKKYQCLNLITAYQRTWY